MNPFTLNHKQVALPKIAAPALNDLAIVVPKPKPITEDDLIARLLELQRVYGVATARKPGEAIVEGDEVCVNVLAYAQGKLVPRSPQFDTWLVAGGASSLPELSKALKLGKVGDSLKVKVTLPDGFHVPALRGVPAVYLVEAKAAQKVVPAKTEDPAFLAKLGAKTVKEALERISNDLVAQRTLKATFEALELAVDAVAKRADVKISPALLKQEVWNQWRELEGKALADRGLVGAEQTESFDSWQADEAIVGDIERRLRNSIVIGALSEAHAQELTADRIASTARRLSSFLGVTSAQVDEVLKGPPDEKNELAALLVQLATAELVLENASISYL
jgi:trigger factor